MLLADDSAKAYVVEVPAWEAVTILLGVAILLYVLRLIVRHKKRRPPPLS
jgi:hypothetical protein